MDSKNILVMGAGSWGTALAIHLSSNNHRTIIWSHNSSHCQELNSDNENKRYLPNIKFPTLLSAESNWKTIINDVDIILICVPSHAYETIVSMLSPYLKTQGIVWATKGLCHSSNKFLSEINFERLPKHIQSAIITGPSFAREVAQKLPTAVAIASNNLNFAKKIQEIFRSSTFRSYVTDDLIGTQIGGAVKNILAIATGISDGMGFGANARSAIITRGLAELKRLGSFFGAREETLMGLSCVGDLILTCTDDQSRNRRFGILLGQGMEITNANQKIGQVVEGIKTTKLIHNIIMSKKIEMPIVEQVYKILYNGINPNEALKNLMHRSEKEESI